MTISSADSRAYVWSGIDWVGRWYDELNIGVAAPEQVAVEVRNALDTTAYRRVHTDQSYRHRVLLFMQTLCESIRSMMRKWAHHVAR